MNINSIAPDWPAWIQAIGSLIALVFAIAIPAIQRKNELADRRLERKEVREALEHKIREEEQNRRKRACDLATRLVPEIQQAIRFVLEAANVWSSTAEHLQSLELYKRSNAFRHAAAAAAFPLGVHLQQWIVEHRDIEWDEGGMLLRQLGLTQGLYNRELELLILRSENINNFTDSCTLMHEYCNQFAKDANLAIRLLKVKHGLIDVDADEVRELQRSSLKLAELEAKNRQEQQKKGVAK
ncbi:MAG: hypothetical protein V4545_11250 [Pseudomonadota bacterium]